MKVLYLIFAINKFDSQSTSKYMFRIKHWFQYLQIESISQIEINSYSKDQFDAKRGLFISELLKSWQIGKILLMK